MENLRGVLSSFQTTLCDMEQRQGNERGVVQRGLKNEMIAMHQRGVKQAVSTVINITSCVIIVLYIRMNVK